MTPNITVSGATSPTVQVTDGGDVIVNVADTTPSVVVDVSTPVSGTGDVTSSSLSLDNQIVRFDGTSGKVIQNSGITIADGASGTLSGTNSGDVTIGAANGLSLAGQALSLGLSSSSTTGALSSTDWQTFNGKQDALTRGDLTVVIPGGSITGGENAVIGIGAVITIQYANQLRDGVISKEDWETFNLKQPAGNYITALTGDVTASGPGSVAATLSNTGVTPGSYTNADITIGSDGRISAASNGSGGGGSGTVTSVAISGTDGIQVDSGSPITTSGTIQLGVDAATMKTTLDLAGTNTGDQNVFSTFAVSGQSNVVADSTADTLTLVAGSNITITTDASTDSITINSTASGSGDVVGPASSVDGNIALFDGATGKFIKNGAQITDYLTVATAASTYAPLTNPNITGAITISANDRVAVVDDTGFRISDSITNAFSYIRQGLIEVSDGINLGTLLPPASPADVNMPSTTGTLISTGDTGTVTDTMLAGSISPSKITGTAAVLGANTFTGTQSLPTLAASSSGGLTIDASNGTDIGILGAGNTANVEWYGSHNFSTATQDTIAAFTGAGKTLSSLATSTYPSLTELSYVKGVTSAIQTQIDGKQASDAQLTSLAALSYTGNAGKVVAVNGAENNFELISVGGTGTVTSVAISGTDGIEVDSGSPITTSGTIQLGVNAATMKTTLNLSGTNTGDQNLFGAIAVSGQSNVVADTTNDTLTLVAGTNITITTDAATDSITINSTASGSGDVVGPASATDNAIARFDSTTGKLIQNSGITIADGASGTLAGSNSGDVTLAGTPDYITIAGQVITRGLIDLTTDVTGDLPLTNFAQASAASKLLGRGSASGAGDFQEITLGSGLSMSGTTLSASGGSSNVDVKLYTANDTWTNPSPSTAKRVFVKLVGGGAGGGSGRKGAAGTNRYGGSGGAPGATVETWFLTTDLASTISVTIGAGGTGGAAVTANSTDGNNGTAGGTTTFSTVSAVGGLAGVRGTATSANQPGGKSSSCLFGLTSAASLASGSGSNTTGATVAASIASFPTGGGGGGGLNTSNATASGGAGGGLGEGTYMQLVAGGTAGSAGSNGGNGNSARGVGTGGGGGGSSASGNAGAGGNGGGYGAGGGGGGASTDSVGDSGKGGDGSGGYALIITYT